jgi:hypothetical protein
MISYRAKRIQDLAKDEQSLNSIFTVNNREKPKKPGHVRSGKNGNKNIGPGI